MEKDAKLVLGIITMGAGLIILLMATTNQHPAIIAVQAGLISACVCVFVDLRHNPPQWPSFLAPSAVPAQNGVNLKIEFSGLTTSQVQQVISMLSQNQSLNLQTTSNMVMA